MYLSRFTDIQADVEMITIVLNNCYREKLLVGKVAHGSRPTKEDLLWMKANIMEEVEMEESSK